MIDMKEFWNKVSHNYVNDNQSNREVLFFQNELGLFFWERGGKQFILSLLPASVPAHIKFAKDAVKIDLNNFTPEESLWAKDFLDCVDCLGEEQVKELIKELEE